MEIAGVFIVSCGAGFLIGNAIGLARWIVKEDKIRKNLKLYELTDLMTERMIEEENKDSKEERARKIRLQIRQIVEKEFEE